MNSIEVCFSPKLIESYDISNKTVLVVDILRASTIITTMFHNGLDKLIPVRTLDEAKEYKSKAYLVAAERKGKKVDFADFDNSPYSFTRENIENKTIVYSTLNGTNTINLVKKSDQVIIASFLNISSVAQHLTKNPKDVLMVCSGWQGNYCIEDALFAGALSEKLLENDFTTNCDSVRTSVTMWISAKNDLKNYIKNMFQYKRLKGLGLEHVIDYCFNEDITNVIPVLRDDYVVGL